MKKVKVGIIGGGLMGKEAASAFGRWFVFKDIEVYPELVAVADLSQENLDWYKKIESVKLLTTDYKVLLAHPEVDVVYIAVPHHLHLKMYTDVLAAGKDMLGEKPFGIDLKSANQIAKVAKDLKRFVRCSSEMPFLPGSQKIVGELKKNDLGKIIEINTGFLHASDMDFQKEINWKRQSEFCGDIGVMGDLGMHVMHIPLRFNLIPHSVYAQLQKIVKQRPDKKGEMVTCDTWNNASLNTWVNFDGEQVPMTLEMKRLAPGETNTWYIEILGTKRSFRYSTKDTKAFWSFKNGDEQSWQRTDLGFDSAFPTITGKIFEAGFTDCFMQMLASFFLEREGLLEDRFGCVTPEEAVLSHQLFESACLSHKTNTVVEII